MRLEALGTVGHLRDDGERIEVPSRKRRLVLALLLSHANEWVRTDRIVDVLWDGVPPRSAAANVKTYVSSLRRLVADDAVRIANGANGYRLAVARDDFDVPLFEDGVTRGRAAWHEGRVRDAVDMLRGALDLWRGEPFADLTGAEVEAARAGLGDQRLAAHEHLARALMASRRHDEAVVVLRQVVAESPFLEQPRGLLMTALHQTGRSVEALEVYDDARRVLDRELGLRPGADLRRLQAAILDHDPGLDATRPPSAPVLARLPATPDVFAGREGEPAALTAAVESGVRPGRATRPRACRPCCRGRTGRSPLPGPRCSAMSGPGAPAGHRAVGRRRAHRAVPGGDRAGAGRPRRRLGGQPRRGRPLPHARRSTTRSARRWRPPRSVGVRPGSATTSRRRTGCADGWTPSTHGASRASVRRLSSSAPAG